MQTEKIAVFLEVTARLNDLNITPVLYGSLGLHVATHTPMEVNDIDILIPETFLHDGWDALERLMKELNFTLHDKKEHEFAREDIMVSFASEEMLRDIPLTSAQLHMQQMDGKRFKTLTPTQFLAVYTYCLTDGYRQTKRSDGEKIAMLRRYITRQEAM